MAFLRLTGFFSVRVGGLFDRARFGREERTGFLFGAGAGAGATAAAGMGATDAGVEPVRTCALLLFTPTCVEATIPATTAALGAGAAGGGCAGALEARPGAGFGGGTGALAGRASGASMAGGGAGALAGRASGASMAGGGADEGRRRRREGGGLERLRDFSLPRRVVDQNEGPCVFASQPVFVQVGMENEGSASKFF